MGTPWGGLVPAKVGSHGLAMAPAASSATHVLLARAGGEALPPVPPPIL